MKKFPARHLALGSIGLTVLIILGACAQNQGRTRINITEIAGARFTGSTSCKECHEDLNRAFQRNNIHARLAEFEYLPTQAAGQGCEACHGPAGLHVEEGDSDKILQFGKLDKAQASAVCQNCHSDGDTMEWRHSTHAAYGLGCDDCHIVHGQNAGMALAKPQPELCYDCHNSVRAKMHLPNHHPVKEGKMNCNDCHNPHGSQTRPLLRTDEWKNELCLRCHMEQSGPFAFEHAPVTEDCTICHSPHGTTADNLLKQNEPFLCLQCHELHFHTNFRPNTEALQKYADDGIPGAQTILNAKQGTGMPDNRAMQRGMMTRCSQCHPKVHGSDLPSLYTPGGGSRLTR